MIPSCSCNDCRERFVEEVSPVKQRESLTIRFPAEIIAKAREAKAERESLNEFIVEAVEREVRRRQGLEAYAAIRCIREQVKVGRGLHPDSLPLIRALREGAERRG